jgi:hypothetical protein
MPSVTSCSRRVRDDLWHLNNFTALTWDRALLGLSGYRCLRWLAVNASGQNRHDHSRESDVGA